MPTPLSPREEQAEALVVAQVRDSRAVAHRLLERRAQRGVAAARSSRACSARSAAGCGRRPRSVVGPRRAPGRRQAQGCANSRPSFSTSSKPVPPQTLAGGGHLVRAPRAAPAPGGCAAASPWPCSRSGGCARATGRAPRRSPAACAAPRRRGRSACGSPRAPSRRARPPAPDLLLERGADHLELDGGDRVLLEGVARAPGCRPRPRRVESERSSPATMQQLLDLLGGEARSSAPAPRSWAGAPARPSSCRARVADLARPGPTASGAGGRRARARTARGRSPAAPTTPRRR